MNYKIILDNEHFLKFVNWLPDLTENECYYVSLFARKKYHESAKNDKSQCKRFAATSKDWLIRKVKQLEVPLGCYTNKDGSPVHQDSLALYISINPRSFKRAQNLMLKSLANKISESQVCNPSGLALSCIQKSKSRTIYVDFDFDIKYLPISSLRNASNCSALEILHTRGGFHLLVDPSKVEKPFQKTWYSKISSIPGCDVSGDNLIPVAGCTQGGYCPRILSLDNDI